MLRTIGRRIFGKATGSESDVVSHVAGDVASNVEKVKQERTTVSESVQSIEMYTTRFCPYCMRAKALLDSKGWSYHDIPVDGDQQKRAEMMEKAGRHTVPQIWIGDYHVGGCDELFQLERAGKLDQLVMGAS